MDHQQETRAVSRRTLVAAAVAGAGAIALAPREALAQSGPVAPPSTVTTPPRDFSRSGAPTTYFTDPDVLTVDPSFAGLLQPNAPIQRLWTGALWSEGPAWNAQGHYLVWSDIPNNRQLRWMEDDARVSVFRTPSNNSNGNTFDYQGRQISCEHLTRRVVRYELDGSATVLADSYNGKRLNSPNDAVPHPDGSIWFTDPPYGGQLYEGEPDASGGPTNPGGKLNPRLGQPAGFTPAKRELPTNVYRWDPSGNLKSSSPKSRSLIRTASCSRRIIRSSTSSARAKGRATLVQVARATSTCLTLAPTTSCPARNCSATASWTV